MCTLLQKELSDISALAFLPKFQSGPVQMRQNNERKRDGIKQKNVLFSQRMANCVSLRIRTELGRRLVEDRHISPNSIAT